MADADGKPRLGCLHEPRSRPGRDFAGPGRHGLTGRLCRHSREQLAQAPFTADNTPIRSGPEGLEFRCRKECPGNPGSIDFKREPQSHLTPLIAAGTPAAPPGPPDRAGTGEAPITVRLA